MDRRAFLARAAALGSAGTMAGLAGCLDGGSRADSPTETYVYDTPTDTAVAEFVSKGAPSISRPNDAELVVGLTVVNQTDTKGRVTVTATVTFEREVTPTTTPTGTATSGPRIETITRTGSKTVTIPAGGEKTVRVAVEKPDDARFAGVRFDLEPAS